MMAMCRRQQAEAHAKGEAFKKCLVPKQAHVDDFLIQVDNSLKEQKRTEEQVLPRRRKELWVEGADLALEASNAAARVGLLAALVWRGGGKLSQAAAAVALGGPVIRLGLAWVISVTFWERELWDMYSKYVLLPRWLVREVCF